MRQSNTCLTLLLPDQPAASTNSSNSSPESLLEACEGLQNPPATSYQSFLCGLLTYTRGKDAHTYIDTHTPVCHRSPLGLPQTCADITIKPRTPRHCMVIHHMQHTHTNTLTEGERVSSCMLRGRHASRAGSSTKHHDWGVKINFQPQSGSSYIILLLLSGFSSQIKEQYASPFSVSGFALSFPLLF